MIIYDETRLYFGTTLQRELRDGDYKHCNLVNLPVILEMNKEDTLAGELISLFQATQLVYFFATDSKESEICIKVLEDEKIALIAISIRDSNVLIAAPTPPILHKITEKINKAIKKHEETITNESVLAQFWLSSCGHPYDYARPIDCPSFSSIRENYSSTIQKDIDWLYTLKNPWEIGKLLFWMGPPGTGKTFCIRALMEHWKDLFNIHIIMDPEEFLRDPKYLLQVLMDRTIHKSGVEVDKKNKGELVIIEDCPRAVMKESRSGNDSYNMSRLLNLTDGILGQGLSVMFLLTTNDDIKDIDSAFLRDGRCLQRLFFDYFEPDEANKWFKMQDCDFITDDDLALSEMYAKLLGKEARLSNLEQPFGFALRKEE